MKTVAAAFLGTVLGVVLGAIGIHQWLMPQLVEANARYAEVEQKLSAVQSAGDDATDTLARLESERDQLNDRLAALQDQLDTEGPTRPVAPLEVPMVSPDAPQDAAEAQTAVAANSPEAGRRGDRGSRGNPWESGTPEEQEARRQDFTARLQDNMADFFTGELEKSSTPEMQERLVALEQKTQEMFDLRKQMREASTDEDREALGQAFFETMNSAREIMQEQQSDILGAIANQFGISKESDQAAFEQAVRSAMESPMFSNNPGALLWGAGRGEGVTGMGRGNFGAGGGASRGGFGGGGFGGGR